MKTALMKSLPLLVCLAVTPSVTGCGKSSPTAPEAAPEPVRTSVMHTTVRFDYVKVLDDGDFIGDGEFEFRYGVNGANTFSAKTLRTDDVLTIHKEQTVDGEGSLINVYFEASEWDADLLGNDFRDPDMDKRHYTQIFRVAEGLKGQRFTTLGNADCKVELYYTLITYYTLEYKNP